MHEFKQSTFQLRPIGQSGIDEVMLRVDPGAGPEGRGTAQALPGPHGGVEAGAAGLALPAAA